MSTPVQHQARSYRRPDDHAAKLLLRAAGEDDEAFAELYDLTASRVYGLVLRIMRDPHYAEEVTQEGVRRSLAQVGQL